MNKVSLIMLTSIMLLSANSTIYAMNDGAKAQPASLSANGITFLFATRTVDDEALTVNPKTRALIDQLVARKHNPLAHGSWCTVQAQPQTPQATGHAAGLAQSSNATACAAASAVGSAAASTVGATAAVPLFFAPDKSKSVSPIPTTDSASTSPTPKGDELLVTEVD